MNVKLRHIPVALVSLILLALLASGCGGSTYSKSSSSKPAASSATVSTKTSDVGTILAGAGGKTLYLFEADKNGKPTCSGDCAAAWPPALAAGDTTVAGEADQSKVGTVAGTKQITYAGHPLYYYAKDTDAEDVYGNGIDSFGAEWYALTPAGANAEEKTAEKTTPGY
jgi:predicted lipoprotein with Yx(FWY)xxD motif